MLCHRFVSILLSTDMEHGKWQTNRVTIDSKHRRQFNSEVLVSLPFSNSCAFSRALRFVSHRFFFFKFWSRDFSLLKALHKTSEIGEILTQDGILTQAEEEVEEGKKHSENIETISIRDVMCSSISVLFTSLSFVRHAMCLLWICVRAWV